MKMTLLTFLLVSISSSAYAARYSVNCFTTEGQSSLRVNVSTIKDVSWLNATQVNYKVHLHDGRTLYVPKAACVVEQMLDSQTPTL